MEKHFLADFVSGKPGFVPEPWYNPEGDCIIYKSEDVAVIAERIDGTLTLFLSADKGEPIGFQIKGIQHLIKQTGCNFVAVDSQRNRKKIEITVALFAAFMAHPQETATPNRLRGYGAAADALCRAPAEEPFAQVE